MRPEPIIQQMRLNVHLGRLLRANDDGAAATVRHQVRRDRLRGGLGQRQVADGGRELCRNIEARGDRLGNVL